jgi:hypothetical protein
MSDATWNGATGQDDWNAASNWSSHAVPNGQAQFNASAQTVIGFSQVSGSEVDGLQFAVGAPGYTFCFGAASPATPTLNIVGAGVDNASMSQQSFIVAATSTSLHTPQLQFSNQASAGAANSFYCAGPVDKQGAGGGVIRFTGRSSAGAARFMAWTGAGVPPRQGSTVGGEISFGDNSTAERASFVIYGSLGPDGDTFGNAVFHDRSTAANARFTNVGGTVSGGDGGNTQFYDQSSAALAQFHNQGGTVAKANGGDVAFDGTATGAQGQYFNHAAPAAGAYGGVTSFNNNPPHMNSGGASAGQGLYVNYGACHGAQGGGGHLTFSAKYGWPTAASAIVHNHGSDQVSPASAGHTIFSISTPTNYYPTAAQGTFYNHPALVAGGAAGYTQFAVYAGEVDGASAPATTGGVPTADQGTFISLGGHANGAAGGYTVFAGNTSAGQAVLMAYGGSRGGRGGRIVFRDAATGDAASVYLADDAELDISAHKGGFGLANLDLAGGVLQVTVGGTLPLIQLSGRLAMRGGTVFAFQGGSVTVGTPFTLLTAVNLDEFSAAQFSGNAVSGMTPTFSIVGQSLQVVFS